MRWSALALRWHLSSQNPNRPDYIGLMGRCSPRCSTLRSLPRDLRRYPRAPPATWQPAARAHTRQPVCAEDTQWLRTPRDL